MGQHFYTVHHLPVHSRASGTLQKYKLAPTKEAIRLHQPNPYARHTLGSSRSLDHYSAPGPSRALPHHVRLRALEGMGKVGIKVVGGRGKGRQVKRWSAVRVRVGRQRALEGTGKVDIKVVGGRGKRRQRQAVNSREDHRAKATRQRHLSVMKKWRRGVTGQAQRREALRMMSVMGTHSLKNSGSSSSHPWGEIKMITPQDRWRKTC